MKLIKKVNVIRLKSQCGLYMGAASVKEGEIWENICAQKQLRPQNGLPTTTTARSYNFPTMINNGERQVGWLLDWYNCRER